MARTAEELIALREKREREDREKSREERRRATNRAKRRKMGDGDLIKQLGLTTEELRLLRLELPALREKWARRASGRGAREEPTAGALPEAAE